MDSVCSIYITQRRTRSTVIDQSNTNRPSVRFRWACDLYTKLNCSNCDTYTITGVAYIDRHLVSYHISRRIFILKDMFIQYIGIHAKLKRADRSLESIAGLLPLK